MQEVIAMENKKRMASNGDSGEEELEKLEMDLLLEGVYRIYGYDFRLYAYPSLRRRIWHRVYNERLQNISELQAKVLHDRETMERLVADLIIHVTEMFRDPPMFAAFRKLIVPRLRSYPAVRIWHAGCSTGEEAYSMAILLQEEGLFERTTIYATDISGNVLQFAEQARYPLKKMRSYTKNYILGGGKSEFSKYYTAARDTAIFNPDLREHIVFAQHNLVTDRSFNEFHVIFCRNVMIYFNVELQSRVHELFYDSLKTSGFLVLGDKENITFTKHAASYETIDPMQKIYVRMK
jgi:chemotaxis protein methyltransferase CheR